MFTGLVTDVGEVIAVEARGDLKRLRIATSYAIETIADGASIACGGPCLTVVATGKNGDRSWFDVDVAAETLARTNAHSWRIGTKLNLERSLKLGDELGGHIVSGHVDGVGEAVSATPENASTRWVFRVPGGLARFIAAKGSIAVDGISLTVNEVQGNTFGVNIIPHTASVTSLGSTRAGDKVNIEIDMLARYVARLVDTRDEAGSA